MQYTVMMIVSVPWW